MPGMLPDLDALRRMAERFAPVDLGADLTALDAAERGALAALIEAARVMDEVFLDQVWAGNRAMLRALETDRTPLGRARVHYFLLNKGPWSRLDDHAPFVPGAPPKPGGAGFYPSDATKAEVAAWLDTEAGAAGRGFFTTIRRDDRSQLAAVPYSVGYRDALTRAGGRLRDAAARTAHPTLARYLRLRAEAFDTNDYYASDVAWMELDTSIEPTIGPYEVYEDEWFNAKAAFEAIVAIRDDAETARLADLGRHLQTLEDHLPIAPCHRNPKIGALAPIRVVNEVFAAGDANRGVHAAAFNLPNDERVIREHGAKRVMLRNVQQEKFDQVLRRVADEVLAPDDCARVSFGAFFTHVLLHELMHGLGPHDITVGGRRTTVRQELRETYSAIEEAKADISGLWALWFLADRGIVDAAIARSTSATVLASMFRSLRFGVNEAHGRGVAIQLAHLLEAGAVRPRADGRFEVDEARARESAATLTGQIMTLQAEGDYRRTRDLVQRHGTIRPEVRRALDRLEGIPVDIEPRFVTAEQLRPASGHEQAGPSGPARQ